MIVICEIKISIKVEKMKLKELIEYLNQFDPELDFIFGDKELYPYSFSGANIGKLGAVEESWTIDPMIGRKSNDIF